MAAPKTWTVARDRRLAATIDRAADALYEAVKAAREAGLKVYVDCEGGQDGDLAIDITVERPIPLPSDGRADA